MHVTKHRVEVSNVCYLYNSCHVFPKVRSTVDHLPLAAKRKHNFLSKNTFLQCICLHNNLHCFTYSFLKKKPSKPPIVQWMFPPKHSQMHKEKQKPSAIRVTRTILYCLSQVVRGLKSTSLQCAHRRAHFECMYS